MPLKTFVKVGGVTDAGVLALIPEGGAAGFVVGSPGSPRNLALDKVGELVDQLPPGAEAWATVHSPSPETVHQLFDEAGVDRIQVYGAIPLELEFLEVHHLVPSLGIPRAGTTGPDPTVPPAEDYSRLHLDVAGSTAAAGSPDRPDWEVCHRLVETQPGRKLTLAGGLDPTNVAQALAEVRPWGVDVCVGVERAPGELDPERIRAFLAQVEEAERTA